MAKATIRIPTTITGGGIPTFGVGDIGEFLGVRGDGNTPEGAELHFGPVPPAYTDRQADARVKSADNAADENTRGNVEISNSAEALAGTDNTTAMSPHRVRQELIRQFPTDDRIPAGGTNGQVPKRNAAGGITWSNEAGGLDAAGVRALTATEASPGVVELANQQEMSAGSTTRVPNAATVKAFVADEAEDGNNERWPASKVPLLTDMQGIWIGTTAQFAALTRAAGTLYFVTD